MQTPPWWNFPVVQTGAAIGTGQSEVRILKEEHLEWQNRYFNRGRIAVVAQQNVADGQRQIIHRPRRAYAKTQRAFPSQILHCAEGARGKNFDHLITLSIRNRIKSPGDK